MPCPKAKTAVEGEFSGFERHEDTASKLDFHTTTSDDGWEKRLDDFIFSNDAIGEALEKQLRHHIAAEKQKSYAEGRMEAQEEDKQLIHDRSFKMGAAQAKREIVEKVEGMKITEQEAARQPNGKLTFAQTRWNAALADVIKSLTTKDTV